MRGILRGLLAGQHETTTAKGAAAETRAAEFLAGQGLVMLERNFRVKGGVDLTPGRDALHNGQSALGTANSARSAHFSKEDTWASTRKLNA